MDLVPEYRAGALISAQKICPHCGSVDRTDRTTPGSFAVEFTLWALWVLSLFVGAVFGIFAVALLMFGVAPLFFAALIYSIWRASSRYPVCAVCKQTGPIDLYTPRGRLLLKHYGHNIEPKQPEPDPEPDQPLITDQYRPKPKRSRRTRAAGSGPIWIKAIWVLVIITALALTVGVAKKMLSGA